MSLDSSRRQRGMTLIELLVAMAIGLIVTLAVTSVLIIGESNKRTTGSTNDTNQSGTYAAYAIDRVLRSAGSGFAQSWNLGAFGCRLSASRSIGGTPTTILPRAIAFPAPFAGVLAGVQNTLRVAPVLIANNQSAGGSDVLVVMGGNASMGDVPRPIRSGVAGTNNLRMDNTIGFTDGDVGLVMQNGVTDCLIEQVSVPSGGTPLNTAGNEVLPIGGIYVTTSGTDTSLATFAASSQSYFTTLGNLNAGNMQFALVGVDANRTLMAYDLLRASVAGTDGDAMQPLAEGVEQLHAMYGMDTNNDGVADLWIDPGAANYDIASLMTRLPKSPAVAPYTMRQIMAIRVALVMRSSNYEKEVVTRTLPVIFDGTAGRIPASGSPPTLPDVDQHYRYRVIDTTIPLRNMLLLPIPTP